MRPPSIYHKPTFTGQYTRWDSFTAQRYKINLVQCLVNRTKRICSSTYLPAELDNLRRIFSNNRYPRLTVDRTIDRTLNPRRKQFGLAICSIYLCLPWKGQRPVEMLERAVMKAVNPTLPTYEEKVVYASKPVFQGSLKDQIPTHEKSNGIYLFTCRCGDRYVGKKTTAP